MLLHCVPCEEPKVLGQGNFCQHQHQPVEQSTICRHLIILRIYCGVASKLVGTGKKLLHFTVQLHPAASSILLGYLKLGICHIL